ncbi:MAG: YcxB family protein [Planctomycetota bacterium]|nr:MAG: YcxB family protein [Planctomycetota bacterium]
MYRLKLMVRDEDYFAFSEYSYSKLKTVQLSKRKYRRKFALLFFVLALVLWNHGNTIEAGVLCTASVFSWFFIPHLASSNYRKHITSIVQECENGFGIGPLQIETTEAGVRAVDKDSETTVRWRAIFAIVETEQHLFIYQDPIRGWIIPRKQIAQPEYQAFRDFAQNRFEATRPAAP